MQPAPFGAASGYVQFIAPNGTVEVPAGQGTSPRIAVSASDRAIAASGTGSALSDRTVKGTKLRVLTIGTGASGAVMIARPLTEMNKELSRILLLLVIVGVAGIALAAILGALVARVALAPIARFTKRTEALTGNLDLSRRLDVEGRDELARLAGSFNTTLDALERSVEAQRQLIADAGHELRTPIASLRANIQVLGEAERLPADEQESLRADIVSELDELTALVSDVVELARGAGRGEAEAEDVRLDEVVQGAVERTRRRGDLRFELDLEPTLVRGQGERIVRAVSNLLENAHKWSPDGWARRDRPARRGADRPRSRARVRRGGPAVRVRPLLPRRPCAQAAGVRSRPRDRAPGGGGLRGVCRGGERAGGRGAATGQLRCAHWVLGDHGYPRIGVD